MADIEVIRGKRATPDASTKGILRRRGIESEGFTLSRSEIARGAVSHWHHHGERELFGFVISGGIRLDYGPKGSKRAKLAAGDFFRIAPGIVHRDVNPSKDTDCVIIVASVGKGPTVVNLDGPSD